MGNVFEEVLRDAEKAQGQCPTSYEIDLARQYDEPRYLLRINGVGTIPRGDIQAVKAKSKNGKSFLCSIIAAGVLGNTDFGMECAEYQQAVLYFDTEQCERNTASLARRVHRLMGWPTDRNNQRFRVYSLRSLPTDERLGLIIGTVKEHRPALVVIDGVVDLLDDFNSIEQSSKLIAKLMELSAECDCAITCVLHTNKADNNMRGHLGAMLLQKCSDTYEVVKSGNTFSVSQTDCRNMPVEDFAFSIDANGIPYSTATAVNIKQQEKMDSIKDGMIEAFGSVQTLTRAALAKRYMAASGVVKDTAYSHIRKGLEFGVLKSDKDYIILAENSPV